MPKSNVIIFLENNIVFSLCHCILKAKINFHIFQTASILTYKNNLKNFQYFPKSLCVLVPKLKMHFHLKYYLMDYLNLLPSVLVASLYMYFYILKFILIKKNVSCVLKRMYSDNNLAKTVTSLLTLLK